MRLFFAERFPGLEWQPSDVHPDALASIAAWRAAAGLPNLREPIVARCRRAEWPIARADAVLSINMVHISPWRVGARAARRRGAAVAGRVPR